MRVELLNVPDSPKNEAYRVQLQLKDRDGNIVGQTPEDKYNHGGKALVYGIVDRFGYGSVRDRERIKVKHW